MTQYNQLCDAISQGAKRVKYADKEVEYRDLEEMLKLKRDIEAELGISNASKPRRTFATFSTGLR